jgi:hypothetical protein
MSVRNLFFLRHKALVLLFSIVFLYLDAYSDATIITNQPPVYADREVSQHVSITSWDVNTRLFSLELSLTATPSNNVQVAFGVDTDTDGHLPVEETKATIGWLAGKWFILPEDQRSMYTSAPQDGISSTNRTLKLTMRLKPDFTPDTLTFKDGRGNAITFDGLTSIPSWMHPREWDTARLTARGWDDRDETAKISLVLDGTKIIVR